MHLKGTLPALILQSVAREPNHGYRIAQDIKSRSKGVLDFKEGTLYPALHGFENRGLLESYEQVENGRVRRFYRLTDKGREQLAREREEWRAFSAAMTVALGET